MGSDKPKKCEIASARPLRPAPTYLLPLSRICEPPEDLSEQRIFRARLGAIIESR